MIRRSILVGAIALGLVAFGALAETAGAQYGVNVSGMWQSMSNSSSGSTPYWLQLQQSGVHVVGTYGRSDMPGTSYPIAGVLVGNELYCSWAQDQYRGWARLVFSPNGRMFQGEWGSHAQGQGGTWTGSR